ncbi:hypothetical protein [Gaoshiqia sp. Z1-71]|uniref:hypothetical protein n=1 Tax=Gaoshiqia hydrogeniformans TaxID=3290090 RepID=UPI003BF7856F
MKKEIRFILVFVLLSLGALAQQPGDKGKPVTALFQMLNNYHYHPQVRDSKLSNSIFNRFIKTLDPHGLLFTGEIIGQLEPYRNSLCHENQGVLDTFIHEVTDLYHNRLLSANQAIDSCFNAPFDFSEHDSLLFFTSDSLILPANDFALAERWTKWIKSGILKGLMLSDSDSAFSDSQIPGAMVVNKFRISEKRRISQLLEPSGGFEDFVLNTFLKTVSSCYDPRSEFFFQSRQGKI